MSSPRIRWHKVGREARLLLVGIPVLLWTMIPVYHLFLFAISSKDSATSGRLWPDHPSDPFFNQNGGISPDPVGFVATGNTILSSDPYVSRADKNFNLRAGVCPGKGPRYPVGPQEADHRRHRKHAGHAQQADRENPHRD